MEEKKTWKQILDKLVSDAHERMRLANDLEMNPVTLQRWAAGKSVPRIENMRALVEVIPQQYRQEFKEAVQIDFPLLLPEVEKEGMQKLEIPSHFYSHIFSLYTSIPMMLRGATISKLVLEEIITQLNGQSGELMVFTILCVPPRSGQKVRSLRIVNVQAVPGFVPQFDNTTQFFGAESQPGYAISTGRSIVVRTIEEKKNRFPAHLFPQENSSIAVPILFSNMAAGCVCVISTRESYFTEEKTQLLQAYVNLLVTALDKEQFYDLSTIALGIMPEYEVQYTYLKGFVARVKQTMQASVHEKEPLTLLQAERKVWQEIEEELLCGHCKEQGGGLIR